MHIINFGSCNIDTVYRVPHIVQPGETLQAQSVNCYPGGKGLNQSVALARAGVSVFHAGCIGTDDTLLRPFMQQNNIHLKYLRILDEKTGCAVIQVDDKGENSIFVYSGTNGMITKDYIDRVLDNFQAGDFLLLQNEISNLPYIITQAHQKGMVIMLNPSPFNHVIKQLDLNLIDYLLLNEVEAAGFCGSEDSRQFSLWMEQNYPRLRAVLTLGKRGCDYIAPEEFFHQEAFTVKAVDTTAAGDTFAGYFMAGIAKGETPQNAVRSASAAAALAVSKAGAAPSIPLESDVIKALAQF